MEAIPRGLTHAIERRFDQQSPAEPKARGRRVSCALESSETRQYWRVFERTRALRRDSMHPIERGGGQNSSHALDLDPRPGPAWQVDSGPELGHGYFKRAPRRPPHAVLGAGSMRHAGPTFSPSARTHLHPPWRRNCHGRLTSFDPFLDQKSAKDASPLPSIPLKHATRSCPCWQGRAAAARDGQPTSACTRSPSSCTPCRSGLGRTSRRSCGPCRSCA
jgi:hypothetical protein